MHPDCDKAPPPLVLEGIELFNDGEYFEAHEVLELAWKQESGTIRNMYQGILLVGVGYYHLTCLNYTGALIKLQSGADLLEPFTPICMGINLTPLVAAARLQHAAITERGRANIADFDPTTFPKIDVDPAYHDKSA